MIHPPRNKCWAGGALTPHQHPITALENWHDFLISPTVISDIILHKLEEKKKKKPS